MLSDFAGVFFFLSFGTGTHTHASIYMYMCMFWRVCKRMYGSIHKHLKSHYKNLRNSNSPQDVLSPNIRFLKHHRHPIYVGVFMYSYDSSSKINQGVYIIVEYACLSVSVCIHTIPQTSNMCMTVFVCVCACIHTISQATRT